MSHDKDQLPVEDTLEDRGVDDRLDEGYSPADRPRFATGHGTTPQEAREEETIDERLQQEEPDPASAATEPRDEGDPDDDDMIGGDDPDAIPAGQDVLGDPEVGGERSGRLVAPDEGAHEDADSELDATDVGIDGSAASAEEAAVHEVDQE